MPSVSLNPEVRTAGDVRVNRIRPARGAPGWVELLKDPNRVIRKSAIDTLAKLGATAVPSLVAALEDKTPEIREGAGDVLHKIGSPAVDPADPGAC